MSNNKKYYYLKLKDNYFDSDEQIILESMPDGHLYSNILLKLYVRGLKNDGCLMFKDTIPYSATILAQVTRHPVGVVEKALDIFRQLGLVEVLDNGAIFLLNIQNFIGQSSTEADRIRLYDRKVKESKKSTKLLQDEVKISTPYEAKISTPEIRDEEIRDQEIKEKKEKRKKEDKACLVDAQQVFSFWQKAMDSPRSKLDIKRISVIKNRLEDGYTIDDLLKAIRGCSTSKWHMENGCNGIDYIFRDADHVEKFIRMDNPLTIKNTSYADSLQLNQSLSDTLGKVPLPF